MFNYRVKNPIVAAELVMHHTKHSLLCGDAADNFALEHGCEAATSDYFFTETRYAFLFLSLKEVFIRLERVTWIILPVYIFNKGDHSVHYLSLRFKNCE